MTLEKAPEKLSELVEMALDDIQYIIKETDISIYMPTYIKVDKEGRPCAACLAGCFIIQRIPEAIGKNCANDVDWNVLRAFGLDKAMVALDFVRRGAMYAAIDAFYTASLTRFVFDAFSAEYTPYATEDPEPFFAYLRDIIRQLKEQDL